MTTSWRGSAGDVLGVRLITTGSTIGANPISISTATGTQVHPAVAAQGSMFFLAWADGRNGANSFDIYGTRVDGSGAVHDAGGVAISTDSALQDDPAIASNGTNLLVIRAPMTPTPPG